MGDPEAGLAELVGRLDERLDAIDRQLRSLTQGRRKSLEWVATLSEHVASLDSFREEVRATFEPLLAKLDSMDQITRILRHATSDVSRRVEHLERNTRRAS